MSGSLFNYTPLSDGPLHTAADHNTPFGQIATLLNGGLGTVNMVPKGLDASVLADSANPQLITANTTSSFVLSGLTVGTSGSLSTTIAAGVAYVNGKRLSPSSFPHAYTASKDTYVDLKDDGTYVFVEVANGASSGMTLTTNSDGSPALRVAKVVTSGSAVTAVVQSGGDPLGNILYNLGPASAKALANPHKFSAYATGSVTLASGANFTKIPLNTEDFDTGSNFDSATNFRFTAPVAGTYQFDGHIHTAVIGASRRIVAFLYKNGAEWVMGDENTRSADYIGVSVSNEIYLLAGDYVELFVFSSDAQALDTATRRTRLSGFLVSRS